MAKQTKLLTLALIIDRAEHRILLGMKKQGFGMGKWNGFGGKVELGESVQNAAIREVFEECGLIVRQMKRLGFLQFEFADQESSYSKVKDEILNVHVYRAEWEDCQGNFIESEEMIPKWFGFDEIPYDSMWLDDRYWLKHVIKGECFNGYFLFETHDRIIRYNIDQLSDPNDLPKV